MEIVPDGKDWTWVLERPCPECGLDARDIRSAAVGGMVRAVAASWVAVLAGPDVRVRPAPAVWSPLEYGCHVRDVFRRYDQRLELMLTRTDPLFPNRDQDATAIADRYGEQDPGTVAAGLRAAAGPLASSGRAPDDGATAPSSPSTPSPATSCTTRSTTCTTRPAARTGPDRP